MNTWKKRIVLCVVFATLIAVGAYFFITLLAPSRTSQLKTVTVGAVNLTPALDPVFDGFKAGMAKLGYVEGENVTYIYQGPTGSIKSLRPAIQRLIEAKVDLIFSASTPATIQAKHAVEGTGIPVVFAPVNDPVRSGVVDSLRNPGGNLTGIKVSGLIFVPKGLKWLLAIAPGTKLIYVPHNPDDNSSVLGLAALKQAAAALAVELVVHEIHTSEEVTGAIMSTPEEVDAIFLLPDNLVVARIGSFAKVAVDRTLPLASINYSQAKAGALMGYGFESASIGEQAARLAYQILNGTRPADLPVETPEFFLTINLRTAQAIGLDIPDEILRQADHIIR